MRGTTVTLNTKGIMLVVISILVLTFSLGFVSGQSLKKGDDKPVSFSREELDKIAYLQAIEDSNGTGYQVYAYKTEDGHLWIGWDYTDDHRYAIDLPKHEPGE